MQKTMGIIETFYREAVAAAFEKAKSIEDVVTMLELREICRHLANAGDRADEAANITLRHRGQVDLVLIADRDPRGGAHAVE